MLSAIRFKEHVFKDRDMIKVGFATADISRWIESDVACRRPLEAVCAAVVGADGPIFLFSLDWTEMSPAQTAAVVGRMAETLGTPPQRILLHTQHTHSAPWPIQAKGGEMEALACILGRCGAEALAGARPARMRRTARR